MELSNEDNLRLNILLCQDVKAVRINESQMMLYALVANNDANKEISVKLTPNCNSERYIKNIKEFLSSTILNSPAGYPVFLKQWTRMGQMKNENINGLLKIGEPEAIIAIIYGKSISIETAHYAWWAHSSVESARQLLSHDNIATSDLGIELATFLLEFLPFETEAKDIILTVKLLIERELMDDRNREKLWLKGKRKAAYTIGFLHCDPEQLPELQTCPHPLFDNGTMNNHYLSAAGQNYIKACLDALDRFTDQDSIVLLYEAIQKYFQKQYLTSQEKTTDFSTTIEELARINHHDLTPTLAHSNAVGSLLRRKLEPATELVKTRLTLLTLNN